MWSPTVLVSVGVWEVEDLTGSLQRASGFVLLVAWLSSCSEFRTSLQLGPPEAPITARTGVQFLFSTVSLNWESSCRRYFSWPPDRFAKEGNMGRKDRKKTWEMGYIYIPYLGLATELEVVHIFQGLFIKRG